MTPPRSEGARFIGLMSGTSLDGINAVLAEVPAAGVTRLLAHHYVPYPAALRKRLLALHEPRDDEIHRMAQAANTLANAYADAVRALLGKTDPAPVRAIGCHGQTIRHRPDAGYTLQIGNAARLAELTGITVVTDFRSRDIAAGGQGAPLVPAFHAHAFRLANRHRVIVNIGGIANLTDLPPTGPVRGWDTGPGNMLMDAWAAAHGHGAYDVDGAWAARGRVHPGLLARLRDAPFFRTAPPKSAGREQFGLGALRAALATLPTIDPADVQATLLELTATTLSEAILTACPGASEVYLCGGGVHNAALTTRIATLLAPLTVATTAAIGVDPDWVEALAFAWLARQTLAGQPGNLPEVTGAAGPRVLGAIYPA